MNGGVRKRTPTTGAWKPGQSGNPNGRNGRIPLDDDFRQRCRAAVDEHVIAKWVEEVRTEGRQWMRAGENLAAYGYGRPREAVAGPDGGPIRIVVSASELSDDELASVIRGGGGSDGGR